jgi:acyl carrier protein
MLVMDVRSKLQKVFQDVFDDESIVLEDDMSAEDFDDWDSLQHINIIIATEKQLKIRFTTSEISSLKQPDQNIGSFIRLLEKKIHNT